MLRKTCYLQTFLKLGKESTKVLTAPACFSISRTYAAAISERLKKSKMSGLCELAEKEWYPHQVISKEDSLALLILNQPLSDENKSFIKETWNSAIFKVAVDGGAIQLKDLCDNGASFLPNLVCGDFDSVTPDILKFYKSKGVEIVHTPDQDETDFTKAVRLTVQHLTDNNLKASSILVVSRNGDRLDHLLGNLNTLYFAADITNVPVIILGNNSLTWLLTPGQHKIYVTNDVTNSHVGLIPLGKECTNVTTTGLKWNLTNDTMKFGGLISTCNLFDGSGTVTVKTDVPLIWTMEVKL